MNIKLQQLKSKTKLKFYENISNFFDEMNTNRQNGNCQFEEDLFPENVEDIIKIYHKVLLLTTISETKLQVKTMNFNYYDFYYTVIKNRDEKEIVNEDYEKLENDFCNFDDFIIPDHYIGRKNDNMILR